MKDIFFLLLLALQLCIPHVIYIKDCSDLQNMVVNKSLVIYKLNNSLDCHDFEFEPIGNETNSFKGKFDGQGFSISNLFIHSSEDYTAIFASGENCIFKNVIFSDVSVSCKKNNVGLIFGSLKQCIVSDVHITSTLNRINTISGG